MNMPGFSAEASLCKANERYQSVAPRGYSSGAKRVVSQIGAGGGFGGLGGLGGLNQTSGPVYFQCGWNPKTLRSECTCRGDVDCNNMFTSGFCGPNASCDTGAGTCTCDLAW